MLRFHDENGKVINHAKLEVQEQSLAREYIQSGDCVLELGARYGTVSVAINQRLHDKRGHVCVEPDERVWAALDANLALNGCSPRVWKGYVSRVRQSLTNLHVYYGGYGATSIPDEKSGASHTTVHELEAEVGRPFNVLVADCEGFLEAFLRENPALLESLRMAIFEADYPDKCNYEYVRRSFNAAGLVPIRTGFQNVYVRAAQATA
jgi:FkbM family methyltransferase